MNTTIRYSFGVDVDYYARIGFDSFIRIVDTLGGVTVAVEGPLHDTFLKHEVHLEPSVHHLMRRLYHQALNLELIPKIPSRSCTCSLLSRIERGRIL